MNNVTNKKLYKRIKKMDKELAKQFKEKESCAFSCVFNKGETYSFNEESITLKQDMVAYVEIADSNNHFMHIAFESTQYGNGPGEGPLGFISMSSKEFFNNKIIGYMRVAFPYTNKDFEILAMNIIDMDKTMEKFVECEDITCEGEYRTIQFTGPMVEVQKEYMKYIKSNNVIETLKNSDKSEEEKRIALQLLFRNVSKSIQEQKKNN
jgi:hypothetical protein